MNETQTIAAAMSILGSRTSEAKAEAARRNGKLGGRPRNGDTRAGNSRNRRAARRAKERRGK